MNKKVTNKTLTKRKVNKFDDGAWKKNWKGDKLGGTIASTVGGVANVATNAIQLSQLGDTFAYGAGLNSNQAKIDAIKSQKVSASSLGELNSQVSRLNLGNTADIDTSITLEEAGGPSEGEWATGIMGGIISGAAAGSTIAPPFGTILGGFAGGAAAAIGLGSRQAGAKVSQRSYALKAQQDKIEMERAKEDLKQSVESTKNTILQNQINNFRLHNVGAYGGPLNNLSGDWSNGEYLEGYEYDLDETEINKLLNLGYEIEYV